MTSFSTTVVCKILQQHNLLNQEQVQYIIEHEAEQRKSLKAKSLSNGADEITAVDIISSMQLKTSSDAERDLSEELIMRSMALYWKLPFFKIELSKLKPCKLSSQISEPFARKNLVFPISVSKNMLVVAVVNPTNVEALGTIESVTKLKVRPVISTKQDILKAIRECAAFQQTEKSAQKRLDDFQASVDAAQGPLKKEEEQPQSGGLTTAADQQADDKNIVTAVNLMLQYACEQRASELHIEPRQFYCQIRFRIDGVLYDIKRLTPEVHASMLLRFKALARMDISEKRKPQDGRTHFNLHGRDMMLRIATMPMTFGEKLMIRILDPILLLRHVDTLGFSESDLKRYYALISRSNGIILIAGPTASGKTTTLYSTLDVLSESGINITTIEEPVELPYDRFNQVALQAGVGFTFEQAVRHIVRQSPDVIMIGEIRDKDTARNAIQAALLGNLVFSTLHTHDAASALVRLIKIGTEPFLVESAVIAVVAQRLLRRICPECAEPRELSAEELAALRLTREDVAQANVQRGKGCLKCRGTGYYGQIGIFEIMELHDEIRALIHQSAGTETLKKAACEHGMMSLRQQALAKMSEGVTTCDEVLRLSEGFVTRTSQQFKTKIALSKSNGKPCSEDDLEQFTP